MRVPGSFFVAVALVLAVVGAGGCRGEASSEPLPDGAAGAAAEAGAASTASAGAAGVVSGGAGGEAAECSPIPAPQNWASWRMPNPASSKLTNSASYTVSDSGNVVTDDVTGLVWQRNVDARSFTWDDAKQYCACLTLDGVGGWQLPSRIELASLVDWTATSPSIDAAAFPNTSNENFWTSSPVVTSPGLAYLSFFLNGHTTYSDVTYQYRVRCVQAPTPVAGEHYTLTDGTVYDTQTKLTWQRVIPTARTPWAEAQSYCAALELEGTGWRLPSINELQTLVDDSVNPAIDETAFPDTPSEYFWSSSPVIDDATRAWTAFFTNGSTYSFAATAAKNARCVR